MKKIIKYFKISLISQLREPLSIIFGLLFPILMMVLLVSTMSKGINTESFKFIDKYYFIAICFVILPNTFISIPMGYCYDVQMGFLRQLKFFGVDTILFKSIDLIISIIIIYLEMIIVTIIAIIFFDLSIYKFIDIIKFYVLLLPCIISVSLLGISLISWLKNPNTYLGLGISLMMISLVFSGGMGVRVSDLGIVLEKISNYLPTKYIVESFYLVWEGKSFELGDYFIANIVILGLAILIFSLYYFLVKKRKK